jgi:hypothetical protein
MASLFSNFFSLYFIYSELVLIIQISDQKILVAVILLFSDILRLIILQNKKVF